LYALGRRLVEVELRVLLRQQLDELLVEVDAQQDAPCRQKAEGQCETDVGQVEFFERRIDHHDVVDGFRDEDAPGQAKDQRVCETHVRSELGVVDLLLDVVFDDVAAHNLLQVINPAKSWRARLVWDI
jgi:hypothetical protein